MSKSRSRDYDEEKPVRKPKQQANQHSRHLKEKRLERAIKTCDPRLLQDLEDRFD